MHSGEYGLGIDVGDGCVSAAVCGVDGAPAALPLGGSRVAVAVGGDGRVALVPADGAARTLHLVARVGDTVPVHAGGRSAPAAELVAEAVQHVRELAEERAGRPDGWTVVTVPPSWAGHRRAVLASALTSAGVPRFSLVSSAVAAVSAHVAAGDLPAEPTVAVYDLGARTLDTAVLGPTPDAPSDHLAVPPPPLPWGGRDVDDAVLAHVLACLGTTDGDAGALRAACTAAKEALSTATAVQVADGPVRITREELDEVLLEPARRSATALSATVGAAGLAAADLDAVVLAGGGARVPLVAEILSGELGRPLVVGDDPAVTAALGAATLAAEALTAEPPTVGARPEAAPVAAAAGGPQQALDRTRGGRDRTRPATAPGAAAPPARPAPGRAGRLRRGAVVTGLALGLVLLGPAAAGMFDAVLAPSPTGSEAAGGAADGPVIARGSAAVGDAPAATGDGAAAPHALPVAAAGATGTPARTSLAAAIATAAAPPSDSAPAAEGTATGATTAAGATPAGDAPSPAGETTPPPQETTGTPVSPTPTPPGEGTPSAPPPVTQPAGTPSETRPPTAPGTPTGQTPVEQTPVQETPAPPPPTDPAPVQQPPVQQPPAEQPPPEQPPAEQPPAQQPAPEPPAAEQPATDPAPAPDPAPDAAAPAPEQA